MSSQSCIVGTSYIESLNYFGVCGNNSLRSLSLSLCIRAGQYGPQPLLMLACRCVAFAVVTCGGCADRAIVLERGELVAVETVEWVYDRGRRE